MTTQRTATAWPTSWKTALLVAVLAMAAGLVFAGPAERAYAATNTVSFQAASYGPVLEGAIIPIVITKTGPAEVLVNLQVTGGTGTTSDYSTFLPVGVPIAAAAPSTVFNFQTIARSGPQGIRTITLSIMGTGSIAPNDYLATPLASTTISITDPTGPVITGLGSASQSPGYNLAITGSGFNGILTGTPCPSVTFGGFPASSCTSGGDTLVNAIVPSGPVGTVPVVVTVSGVPSTASPPGINMFQYLGTGSPSITSINPPNGPTSGGQPILILGDSLNNNGVGPVTVNIGGVGCPINGMPQGNSISCTPLPRLAGTYPVSVTTLAGTSPTSPAANYTYGAGGGYGAVTVTSVTPAAGPLAGGTGVSIAGTGLTGASSVMFGSVAATTVIPVSDALLTAVTPPSAITGPVTVTVTASAGVGSLPGGFTYSNGPLVTAVTPSTGGNTQGGTLVTLTGSGFVAGSTVVYFGAGQGTSVNVLTPTSLTVLAPGGTGTVPVWVVVNGVPSPQTLTFTYGSSSGVAVTSVAPISGPAAGGTTLTVLGQGFVFGTNGSTDNRLTFVPLTTGSQVQVNCGAAQLSTPQCYSNGSTSALTVVQPALSTGQYHVVVTASGISSPQTTTDIFTVGNVPLVTGLHSDNPVALNPASGPASGSPVTFVTINGQNFCDSPADDIACPAGANGGSFGVKFGAVASAQVELLSRNKVRARLPAQAAGVVRVKVTTSTGVVTPDNPDGSDQFTYISNCSGVQITGVSPNSGPLAGGNTVTITGCGFSGVTSGGANGVKFGGVVATVTGTATDTSITVTVPAATTAGMVEVLVTTPQGANLTSGTDNDYTYQPAAGAERPFKRVLAAVAKDG